MLSDLSSPIYVVFGAALIALFTRLPRLKIPTLYASWPKIKLQTERQTCGEVQVTDIMLSISGRRPRDSDPKFEFAAYFVLKRRKK